MSDFINDLDKLINDKLIHRWNMERRDYYLLEKKNSKWFKDKGVKNGIMYLGEVDYNHYADVNLLNTGHIIMKFRKNDDIILSINSEKFSEDYETLLDMFISLIEDYETLNDTFENLKRGKMPIELSRNNKLNKILL